MADPKTETQAVLDANQAFYRAMRDGDVAAMERLWARGRQVTCTHPNSPSILGRGPVMASWRLILTRHPPEIHAQDATAIVTGSTALVLCREIIGEDKILVELMASNAWVHESGAWRLVNHQAAPIP